RYDNVFIDVKWCDDSLNEHVHDVVVCIGTIVEFGAKRSLPFLRLKHAVSIRSMKHKPLEVQLPDAANLRPRLQRQIGVIANAVRAFEKTNLWVEIWTNLAALGEKFEPAILIV